jgi:hypothetical protein
MDIDYSALASRVAAFSDVLGCIILSSDGLVLGSFPPADGDGDGIKAAWLRFAGIGNPERGFLKVEDQLWAYVSSGPFAAFAVAAGGTRPGVLLDHLEQTLMVAGESRDNLPAARPPGRVELVAGNTPKAVVAEPTLDELLGSPNGGTENGHEPPPEPRPAPRFEPIDQTNTPIFERIRTHMIEPDYVPLAAALGRSVPQPVAPPQEAIPIAEPMDGPFERVVDEPLDGSFDEPVDQPLDGSFDETVDETLDDPLDGSFDEPTHQPQDGSFEEPAEEALDASLEEPVDLPLDALFDEPAEESIEAPLDGEEAELEVPVDPIGDQLDIPVDEPVADPVDQPVVPLLELQVDGPTDEPVVEPPEAADGEPAEASVLEPDPGPALEQHEELEVDRVALAREFAGLLQEDRRNDEDNA